MKYLITGGAGFIGSNIVEKLVEMNEEVRILDNFSTGKIENLNKVKDKIELIEGDIRDLAIVEKAVKGVDFVLHQAALPSVPRSIKDPLSTHQVNLDGTFNLLFISSKEKVKRFVFASSSSVYGDKPTLPKKEEMLPEPLSPYAASKLNGEYYCRVFYKCFGLETVVLRYFNVFGPHQDPQSLYAAVIPKFIQSILGDQSPVIFGDGKQSRDFTYVENVVEANLLACKKQNIAGMIFNIGGGKQITINELVEMINKITGKNISPRYVSSRQGDVKHSLADISQAKKFLGYKVRVDFEDGLKKTIEWRVKCFI